MLLSQIDLTQSSKYFFRRAVAERAENIGIWFKILDMIAHFAVISNVSLAVYATKKFVQTNSRKNKF